MSDFSGEKIINSLRRLVNLLSTLLGLVLILGVSLIYLELYYDPQHFEVFAKNQDEENVTDLAEPTAEIDLIKDGIHIPTGLIDDVNLDLVVSNCTACHSAKLITQNRSSREGWQSMIRWMQESQKLWDLGENEEAILDYLAKNYAPDQKGRRVPLTNIEWYELEP